MPGINRKRATGCQWCDNNISGSAKMGRARKKDDPKFLRSWGATMPFCGDECKRHWQDAMESAGYETK